MAGTPFLGQILNDNDLVTKKYVDDSSVIAGVTVNGSPAPIDANKNVNITVPNIFGDDMDGSVYIENGESGTAAVQFAATPTTEGASIYLTAGNNVSVVKNLASVAYVENAVADKVDNTDVATSTTLGLVKTNPSESIDVNANGQITVGGRMGQFPNGGIFFPTTIDPTNVGTSSFLMTDGAKGLSVSPRILAIMAGANLTCKSTAAGSTQYRVSNSQANRFVCAAVNITGARAALNQNDAATNGTVAIVSVKYANGNDCVPYFGPTEGSNDIIITLERTINPNSAVTAIRIYGSAESNDAIAIGQGVSAFAKGISIGQSTRTTKQQTIAAGNSVYVSDTNSFGFGNQIYIPKKYCFGAGYMHDFANAADGTTAFGTVADIQSDTILAVGNGTVASGVGTKSNAFEVKRNGDMIVAGGVILKSPNGTLYKLTVADDGTLTTAAV